MELLVQPLGRTLSIAPGSNLLAVLREHDIPISYSCTAGRCGTCRCKVVEGQVLDAGPAAKLTNPHGDGHVLACMTTLTGNCVIEVAEPDEVVQHPARIVKAVVAAIESPTHDIRRLILRPAKPLAYSPGQYAMLQFSPEHIRPYSMAGLDTDTELEFHVRVVPGGRVSGYVAQQLKVGDSLRVSGPLGTAYLRTRHQGPMLCIAGGTGLAPVLAIVRGALAAGMRNAIHVYFGVRSPDDLYGMEALRGLAAAHQNVHVSVVVTMGNRDPQLRSGLITEAVAADWESLAGWRAYLCGAPPMVEAATLLVRQRGIEPEHVHADAFYASAT